MDKVLVQEHIGDDGPWPVQQCADVRWKHEVIHPTRVDVEQTENRYGKIDRQEYAQVDVDELRQRRSVFERFLDRVFDVSVHGELLLYPTFVCMPPIEDED